MAQSYFNERPRFPPNLRIARELTLYHAGTTTYSARPRIALFEKGLRPEYNVPMMPGVAGVLSAAYRSVNPKTVVPSIVHKGVVVTESASIVEYLDEAFPGSYRLLPSSPATRARARLLMSLHAEIQNGFALFYGLKNPHSGLWLLPEASIRRRMARHGNAMHRAVYRRYLQWRNSNPTADPLASDPLTLPLTPFDLDDICRMTAAMESHLASETALPDGRRFFLENRVTHVDCLLVPLFDRLTMAQEFYASIVRDEGAAPSPMALATARMYGTFARARPDVVDDDLLLLSPSRTPQLHAWFAHFVRRPSVQWSLQCAHDGNVEDAPLPHAALERAAAEVGGRLAAARFPGKVQVLVDGSGGFTYNGGRQGAAADRVSMHRLDSGLAETIALASYRPSHSFAMPFDYPSASSIPVADQLNMRAPDTYLLWTTSVGLQKLVFERAYMPRLLMGGRFKHGADTAATMAKVAKALGINNTESKL